MQYYLSFRSFTNKIGPLKQLKRVKINQSFLREKLLTAIVTKQIITKISDLLEINFNE